MSIGFLLPTPPPLRPQDDAYAQEIAALTERFGGETLCINPNVHLPAGLGVNVPRPLFGFHQALRLRGMASRHRLFHVFSPTLYPYPVLATLARPVVYSLTGGWSEERQDAAFFNRLAAVTAPDEATAERLAARGIRGVRVVRTGIDATRFEVCPLPIGDEIRLLMASAPWTREQFAAKGVDALLEAARAEPRLQLTFLWRGVLAELMHERVAGAGLADRVTVIDEHVDVNEVLASSHAAVNLATGGGIVKAYPHSLLEALAAGRPVLVSRQIPMAAHIGEHGLGVVVPEVSAPAVLEAVRGLERDYDALAARVAARRCEGFDVKDMLDSYARVYASIDPDIERRW
jgi:glycosyltransferase involved in cell wall biosynthesis